MATIRKMRDILGSFYIPIIPRLLQVGGVSSEGTSNRLQYKVDDYVRLLHTRLVLLQPCAWTKRATYVRWAGAAALA